MVKTISSYNDRRETSQTVSLKLIDGNTIEETTKETERLSGGTLRRISSGRQVDED